MVYYLGRDVKVYLTTESPESQVSVASNAVSATGGGASSVAAAGVATLTVTDTDALQDRTIIVTTAGGTVITATETTTTTTTNTNSPTFEASTGSSGSKRAAAAANIATCLNGHAKLTATSNAVTYVVTITQVDKGTDGNTTIAGTANGNGCNTTTNFTGGTDGEVYAATIFAENLDEVLGTVDGLTKIPDLTGVDLGIGVVDEDVTYMGAKTVLKVEIKKETTISLTRKKSNNLWDVVYNGPTASNEGWDGTEANKAGETGGYGARWGVVESDTDSWKINCGLMAPRDAVDYGTVVPCFGYRVHIELKSGEEVISIPGCQLTGHSVSLNADGTTEETCELISHVTPKIGTAINYDRLVAADL